MNRAVSGSVVVLETGQPLRGLIILASRLRPDGEELLGWAVSGDGGRFRVEYPRVEGAPDLVLYLYGADGRLLFVEPPHLLIGGAELQLRVEVPLASLRTTLH